MQRFEIFKPGKHTAMSGVTLDFTEEMLRQSAAGYDPAKHEAPLVVGHPKDNAPAYGWVSKLDFADGALHVAETKQVAESFVEMVQAGRFKKRSASFYLPNAPANPNPGVLTLRHVGFLGAMPPAVKGLKDVSFAEQEGVVEFAEDAWVWSQMARAFRGIREWIISKHNVEEADKVLPGYVVEDMENAARRALEPVPAATNSFTEHTQTETATMTDKDKQELEQLRADKAKRDADAVNFAEQQKQLAARERAIARTEIQGQVDALVQAGKVLPAMKGQLVEFALALDAGTESVEFGEGDAKKKLSPRACLLDLLGKQPKLVEFGEHGREEPKQGDPVVAAQQKVMAQVTGQAPANK